MGLLPKLLPGTDPTRGPESSSQSTDGRRPRNRPNAAPQNGVCQRAETATLSGGRF